jgi:transposase
MEKRDGRKLSTAEQELLRRVAVEMVFDQAFSKAQAAKALGISRQNVTLWCHWYCEGGVEALKLGRRGRAPQEQAKLKGWQCGMITKLIRDHYPGPAQASLCPLDRGRGT